MLELSPDKDYARNTVNHPKGLRIYTFESLEGSRMYYMIYRCAVPSLHRESTDSLMSAIGLLTCRFIINITNRIVHGIS